MTHNVAVIGHVTLTLFPGMKLCCLVTRAETISETGLWLTHTHAHTQLSVRCVLRDEIKDSTPGNWNVEPDSPPLSLGCMCISSHLWIHSHVFFSSFSFMLNCSPLSSTLLFVLFIIPSAFISRSRSFSQIIFLSPYSLTPFLFLMQLGSMAALILCNHTGGGTTIRVNRLLLHNLTCRNK